MHRIRVVLDTNVVVSAHLNAEGYERYVLDLALAGKLELYATAEIFAEYQGVLGRRKFGFTSRQVKASLHLLRNTAQIVTPGVTLRIATDVEDNKFLECADAAHAEYLVTGNQRHFPRVWQNTRVVNARELVELIVPELGR